MTSPRLGHSRKVDLRRLLALVDDHAVTTLIEQAMVTFGVARRSVEQALTELEWDGYIKREYLAGCDGRRRVVWLTEKGHRALEDPQAAEALIELPARRRAQVHARRDPSHPNHFRAELDDWRRGMAQ